MKYSCVYSMGNGLIHYVVLCEGKRYAGGVFSYDKSSVESRQAAWCRFMGTMDGYDIAENDYIEL